MFSTLSRELKKIRETGDEANSSAKNSVKFVTNCLLIEYHTTLDIFQV